MIWQNFHCLEYSSFFRIYKIENYGQKVFEKLQRNMYTSFYLRDSSYQNTLVDGEFQ